MQRQARADDVDGPKRIGQNEETCTAVENRRGPGRKVPDFEQVLARDAVIGAGGERVRAAVEIGAIGQRTGKLVERAASRAAYREAGDSEVRAAKPVGRRVPRDLAVVEIDVEVAGSDLRAVDQHELERVGEVGRMIEMADLRPGDAEGRVPGKHALAERDCTGSARVHVREKRSDDRLAPVRRVEMSGREVELAAVERDVAVIAHIDVRVARPEENGGEPQRHGARIVVVAGRQRAIVEAGLDKRLGRRGRVRMLRDEYPCEQDVLVRIGRCDTGLDRTERCEIAYRPDRCRRGGRFGQFRERKAGRHDRWWRRRRCRGRMGIVRRGRVARVGCVMRRRGGAGARPVGRVFGGCQLPEVTEGRPIENGLCVLTDMEHGMVGKHHVEPGASRRFQDVTGKYRRSGDERRGGAVGVAGDDDALDRLHPANGGSASASLGKLRLRGHDRRAVRAAVRGLAAPAFVFRRHDASPPGPAAGLVIPFPSFPRIRFAA